MVQSFAVNAENDLFIGTDNRLVVAQNIEGVLFGCASAAKAQLAEMIYAFDQGVANFETIWTNSVNVAQFEASVRFAIQSVEGVTGIKSFEMEVVNNAMNYSAVIETIYGEGDLNG